MNFSEAVAVSSAAINLATHQINMKELVANNVNNIKTEETSANAIKRHTIDAILGLPRLLGQGRRDEAGQASPSRLASSPGRTASGTVHVVSSAGHRTLVNENDMVDGGKMSFRDVEG